MLPRLLSYHTIHFIYDQPCLSVCLSVLLDMSLLIWVQVLTDVVAPLNQFLSEAEHNKKTIVTEERTLVSQMRAVNDAVARSRITALKALETLKVLNVPGLQRSIPFID
jgi:poly(3-hydroxyalkanoate) synthetase